MKKHSKFIIYAILFVLILVHFFGTKLNFYYVYGNWDILAHSLGGLLIGCSLVYFNLNKIFNILIPIVIVFCWEIFKYIILPSPVLNTNIFITDTLIDIFLGLCFAYGILYINSIKNS